MTTIESNKLIAEFMGVERPGGILQPVIDESHKYHTSWDWLMPVVERIEGLNCEDGFDVRIEGNYCIIQDGRHDEIIADVMTFECSKIVATYKAVVEFIQWYNENKKP